MNASAFTSETSLMIAARYGKTKIVKLLLERGADVNATNKDGENALAHARTEEIGKLLLDKGANVSGTALVTASIYGNMVMLKLLLERGVDVNAKNKDGENALAHASTAEIGLRPSPLTMSFRGAAVRSFIPMGGRPAGRIA